MYKLFLCLRYLRKRVMAYFAVLAVALCVAMMLIVVSVMDGFLNKIEGAAKGLFGDIVIEATGMGGLPYYDEFAREIEAKVPEVEGSSPFIQTYAVLSVPGGGDYRQAVQVAGIRLPERARVSDFASGLFVQEDQSEPTFDPPVSRMIDRIIEHNDQTRRLLGQYRNNEHYARLLRNSLSMQEGGMSNWEMAAIHQAELDRLEKEKEAAMEKGEAQAKIDSLDEKIQFVKTRIIRPSNLRAIIGAGLPGMGFRTPEGQPIRSIVPGHQVKLSLLPLGKGGRVDVSQSRDETFTVVDDSKTDVSSIDASFVYVPFETLQKLIDMDALRSPAGDVVVPARATAIHVKVRDARLGDEKRLAMIRAKVQQVWEDFRKRPEYRGRLMGELPDTQPVEISIKTWRERQVMIISNISAQRTLVVIMFGIISTVAVVLVFVLFYTIVMQKTKDIGVVKAIGGSSAGVAGIFLGYGAAVGFVGSIIGTAMGYIFVRNINPIHDWVGQSFGLVIWNREWFMFDKIPNEVQVLPALFIAVSAIVAGIVGALLPATLAARMQPVEALRYE